VRSDGGPSGVSRMPETGARDQHGALFGERGERRISFAIWRTLPGIDRAPVLHRFLREAQIALAISSRISAGSDSRTRDSRRGAAAAAGRASGRCESIEEVFAKRPSDTRLSMSALVAAMTAHVDALRLGLADRMDLARSRKRRSLGWMSSVLSPISSRKSVPPAAAR